MLLKVFTVVKKKRKIVLTDKPANNRKFLNWSDSMSGTEPSISYRRGGGEKTHPLKPL